MIQINSVYDFLGKEIHVDDKVVYATTHQGRDLVKATVKEIKFYAGSLVVYTTKNNCVRPLELIVIK